MYDLTSEMSSGTINKAPSFANTDIQITNSNSIQITNIKLNGDNFSRWSQSVRMYIRGRGKIGYITGEVTAPATNDPNYAVWDAENSMIMTWLVNSMDDEIGPNYLCYPTVKDLWDNVSHMYSDLGNQSQVYEIQLKLGEIRQGSETVTRYFNTLKRLWQDLDMYSDYEWKSPDDCNHNKKMVEKDRVFKFLAGLSVEFDDVRGRLIGRVPLPSLNEVFSEVRREETCRSVMLRKKEPIRSLKSSALVTTEANVVRQPLNQPRTKEKPRVWCDYCNRPRHTQEICWRLHGKPAN